MKVRLLAYTPNPDRIAGAAARSCRSLKDASGILDENDDEMLAKSLRACVKAGHHSVMEHASFTFSVEGVSRVLTHQLVRHRVASFSQQSFRAVRPGKESYVTPPSIAKDEGAKRTFDEHMAAAWKAYEALVAQGTPTEDARFLLPHAAKTNIVVTMNARELLHFFDLRCCMYTQWELRALAYEMLRLVKEVAPLIFEKAGPSCVSRSVCPEDDKSCPLWKNTGGARS